MMYRNFAIATLLAAPLIVMATQSFLPKTSQPPAGQAAIQPDVPPPPVPVAPPVTVPGAPSADASAGFGQPMEGAGQPALAPGAGLPDTSAPPMTGGMPDGFSRQDAPPGSPNAE